MTSCSSWIIWIAWLVAGAARIASGFFHVGCWGKSSNKLFSRLDSTPHMHSLIALLASIQESNEETSITTSKSTTELWLDLRGTAISPREALLFLASQQNDESWEDSGVSFPSQPMAVDRVLISEDEMDRALQVMDEGKDPILMYQHDADGTIRNPMDQSILYGQKISLSKEYTDPIPALVTVSSGGWVVVDSENIRDENERLDAITSLVEFASAGSSPLLLGDGRGDDTDGSSLTNDEALTTHYDTDGVGGIAISCRSSAAIVNAGGLVTHSAASGSVVTTESGILLQEPPRKEGEADDGPETENSDYKSALVIPFDIRLWKTAAIVFGEESE